MQSLCVITLCSKYRVTCVMECILFCCSELQIWAICSVELDRFCIALSLIIVLGWGGERRERSKNRAAIRHTAVVKCGTVENYKWS